MPSRHRDYIYIPSSGHAAWRHLSASRRRKLSYLPLRAFLRVYCSVAYLFPGFHPDDLLAWKDHSDVGPVLGEAWRRAKGGQLADGQLYPYRATRAAIRHAMRGAHQARAGSNNCAESPRRVGVSAG